MEIFDDRNTFSLGARESQKRDSSREGEGRLGTDVPRDREREPDADYRDSNRRFEDFTLGRALCLDVYVEHDSLRAAANHLHGTPERTPRLSILPRPLRIRPLPR
ncbi:hypothetical protein AVEN_88999-1 [Araneus ventricosus]|uniref:Uncharacterized protein n=1 Tax=Araneus ventricosus TaxID=182803 RepID=A0A4Y2DM15_ARAVE|nr:hypothetical protein AVEN_88999-1 [Araneus ventricosus]